MTHLYLADLEGFTEEKVKQHIAAEYAGDKCGFDYGCPSAADREALATKLEEYDVVVAYESVGGFGCDSASWFLLRNKSTGGYFEFSGGHCSCYGFEGQFDLDPVGLDYLQGDKFGFSAGGYNYEETENQKAVKNFLQTL